MLADLLYLGLFAVLVFLAWGFVHLCDWLTEPSGERYAGEDPKR